jgi:hypothetical protein
MQDGFDITFHEVVPESGVVELVVAELERVRSREGLHCSVIVRRSGPAPVPFDVHVELRLGNVDLGLCGYAVDNDQYYALRQAFAALRDAQAAEEEHPGGLPQRGRRGLRTLR